MRFVRSPAREEHDGEREFVACGFFAFVGVADAAGVARTYEFERTTCPGEHHAGGVQGFRVLLLSAFQRQAGSGTEARDASQRSA